MHHIKLSRFFSFLISCALLFGPMPLAAIAQELLNISEQEISIINKNHDKSYINIHKELSPIAELATELSQFDNNINSPLHNLKDHIEAGYTIIQHDVAMDVLAYIENYLQHTQILDSNQKQKYISQFEDIMESISQGLLSIDAQKLQTIAKKKLTRSYINIATVKGLLSVNDQLVQNISAVDLSAVDATIQNLEVINNVTNLTVDNLSVIEGSVSGTLSVNDEIIKNSLRFNDAAGGEYIGIQAPATVPTSYTLSLPSAVPTASQVLRANASTPTNLEWVTEGGSTAPSVSKTIYVTKYGNDTTGNGSFDTPYLTLAKAIDVANGIASLINPIAIVISSGIYTENNSSGPLIITAAGVSIVGESPSSVIISPNTPANNLLLINSTVRVADVAFRASSALATGVSLSAGNLSVFSNVRFLGFLVGVSCAGGASQTYGFNNCLFVANSTAIDVNDTKIECNTCSIFGVGTIAPAANTGIAITGANSSVAFNSGVCALCATGATVTNDAIVTFTGVSFRRNAADIIQDGASHLTLAACTFEFTDDSSDVDLQISGAGTITEIIGCEFSGLDISSVAQGTGIQVTDSALVNITGSIIHDYVTGIHLGAPSETLSTVLTASSLIFRDCTTDILQEGATTLQFNGCTASSSKISIDDSTNVQLAFFDLENNGALNIGSMSDDDTTLIQVAIDPINTPDFNYKSSLYSTQAVGLDNTASATDPSTLFALSNQNTNLTSITTDRSKIAGIRLVSDEGSPIGGTSALRGWDINKNASTAELSFAYQNSDTTGQSSVAQYTVMQLDGLNNQLQLPTAATQIVFASDTNLYRSSANILKTDDNFIVGTLTPDRAVYTASGTNQLTSSTVTGTELGYLSGVTSAIQTQINGKVAKAGDTMTGTLQLPAGTTALPSLVFTGSTTTGLSAATANTLSFSTNATERMKISSGGVVSINNLTSAGVVHNDASGNLSSSLIVDADITNATISNSKLATISSSDVTGAIVVRDGSGNFATNMITIDGTVTNPTDVATKAYVDSVASTGIIAHTPAIVVSTTDVALTGLQTIDGVTLVASDRVLLINQTDPVENGLWEAQSGAWTRPTDFDTGDTAGQAYVLITDGTVNAGSSYLCSTPSAIIGTDPIFFSLFSLPDVTTGANVGSGTGLVFKNKTGVTLNFRSLLAGTHVSVTNNTDDITIATDATSANTPSTIVARDGSGNFSAGTITASLTGAASLNVLKAGDTMTGALQLPAGTTSLPSLKFTGSTTTGLSANSDILSFSNAGTESMNIDASGLVTITGFTTTGIVHNDAAGLLSSSLIVNADVDPAAAIVDTKLATISTAGKVANSATTATSANTPNTIVLRDGSGNFAAGTITASLTGAASLNVLKAGDTMTGALQLPAGTAALPSLKFTGSTITGLSASSGDLSFSTDGLERLKIANGGTISVNEFTLAGVVHNDSSGDLSSSLIVNADVDANAAIIDTKLATISTAGKVANSATTATSANSASTIVMRDSLGNFSAGTVSFTDAIIADLTVTNCLSDLCVLELSTVDTAISGSLSVNDEVLNGSLTITPFSTAGVLHNNSSGLISSSLIVNADVSASAGIVDTKLATISTAGKVANSATTATSSDTPNTIVLRDGSGNFSTNMITIDGTVTNDTDVTTKEYVDIVSLTEKDPALVVSTSNVTLSGLQTIDGVTLVANDRVLLVNQTDSIENGLWEAQSGAWTRPTDFNIGDPAGTAYVLVTSGTNNAGSSYLCTTPFAVIDTDPITFTLFATASATTGANVGSGTGLVFKNKTGVTLNFRSLLAGTHVSVTNNTNDITIATDATSANTANTIVSRDGTGSFAAQVVSVVDTVASGNLVLSTNPSTSTAGNIMKGANRFIHNYGTSNTFLGINAGNFTMAGSFNTAIGFQALLSNTTGIGNTAIGNESLLSNTTGFENVAIGLNALRSSTTGPSNTAVGSDAMRLNTTGSFNVAVGQLALYNNVSGFFNTALGYHALVGNLVSENVAVGSRAMGSNTTGINNAALGADALSTNITGSNNTAIGYYALSVCETDNNTAVGSNAIFGCDTGANNTVLGANVGPLFESGSDNVLIGANAFASNVTGSDNIAIGTNAFSNATGSGNIGIGSSVGSSLVAGDDNIYIANAGAVESGAIRIGTEGTHTTCFVQGIAGVGVSGDVIVVDNDGQLGITLSSERFKHNIQDMTDASAEVMNLRPVTFVYNDDETKTTQYGLIAEEVEKIFPTIVSKDDEGKPYTVRYQLLPVLLLNEIQKQHITIGEIQNNNAQRDVIIQDLMARVAALEAKA